MPGRLQLWCGENSSQKWFVLKLLLDIDANGQKRKHTFYLAPSFRESTSNLWLSVVGFADIFSLLRFSSPNHLKILIYLTLFSYNFIFFAFPFASSLFCGNFSTDLFLLTWYSHSAAYNFSCTLDSLFHPSRMRFLHGHISPSSPALKALPVSICFYRMRWWIIVNHNWSLTVIPVLLPPHRMGLFNTYTCRGQVRGEMNWALACG